LLRPARTWHDSGVIHHNIDAAKTVDSSFDESFHFSALRDVDRKPDRLSTCGRNLFHDCVDSVLTPRSEYDLGSLLRKQLGGAFSNAAAGSSDHYDLACNI
jgi:hypothetical protein